MKLGIRSLTGTGALALAILLCVSGPAALAAKDPSEQTLKETYQQQAAAPADTTNKDNAALYAEVQRANAENHYENYTGEDIVKQATDVSAVSADIKKETVGASARPVLVWESGTEWIRWEIDVPRDALYTLSLDAYCTEDWGADASRELTVDGKLPFQECAVLAFRWDWENKESIQKNSLGDEIAPSQQLRRGWKRFTLTDGDGMYTRPFAFYLTKGTHTLQLRYVDRDMALDSIILGAPESAPAYSEVKAAYDKAGYQAATKPLVFQAEDKVTGKNSSTLRPVSNDDPSTVPYAPGYRRMNAMGDTTWQDGEQSLTWTFEVEETGLYKLGFRVAQWYSNGQASYRQIAVDGVVPFRELEAYKFVYDSDWRAEYLGTGEGSPYLLYLEAGKPHTLTMTVKMGEYAPIVQELKRSAEELSALLLKITMITGPNPDPNYEYDLEKQIPDLLLDLTNIEKRLSNNVDQLFAISGRNTPAVSSLKQAAAQLRSVIAKPDTIARRIDALNTCQTNIVTWYTSIMQQPLLLDYILLSPPDEPAPDVRSSGWQKFLATCRSFGISFIKDYDSIGGAMEGAAEQTAIKVFTTLSNERGEVMKMLADETFTKRTGIQVNLKIVPAGQVNAGQVNALMLSLVSGRAPDVAIGVEPASAAEFAFRDAALDISGMEGFDALRKDFISAGFDGMTFQNKVYGIPETMDFKVLLVRTDLAEKIGFGVPDTWEELYDSVLPVLNQNKLNFYMPHAAQDYGIFLYQNGGRYYTEDGLRSALDTKEAYAGFKELSELFTSYGLPYSASFFNRFRSGEMPMGVATFGDYMQVAVAAPELAGKWAIAPLPGHRQADGTVDRSYTASIKTAGMLFSGSAHAAEGWEFLKWWMSTETQTEFGTRIESYLGPSAKWNTANIRAYPNLPWNQADLQVLASMWPYAVEVPPVLGGYFTDRHFNNAWNRVVVAADATVTMRDSLEQAVEDINKELDKKQREYAHLLKSPEE